MGDKANEFTFQNDMIRQLVANGWLLGKPENYNCELALYAEDLPSNNPEQAKAYRKRLSSLLN